MPRTGQHPRPVAPQLHALAFCLAFALHALNANAGGGMYLSIGKDGVPVVTDYPRPDAEAYAPGDFERIALRQRNTPHRGLGALGASGSVDAPAQVEVPADLATGAAAWDDAIRAAADKHGVPATLVKAVVAVESRFNPRARSGAGAVGLMQLMPPTARDLGVDPTDPLANLDGGTRYLAALLRHFKEPALALAAYNAGPGRVMRAGGIPNIPETRAYVAQVLGLDAAYRENMPADARPQGR